MLDSLRRWQNPPSPTLNSAGSGFIQTQSPLVVLRADIRSPVSTVQRLRVIASFSPHHGRTPRLEKPTTPSTTRTSDHSFVGTRREFVRLIVGPVVCATFAASTWLVNLGQPNRPPSRVPATQSAKGLGVPCRSKNPAGLVTAEFQLDPTWDTESLAQLADRGIWAYGMGASGDERLTELALAIADLHYIREGRMWCDEQFGEQVDTCVFNLDFVACAQERADVAQVVYARALVNWQDSPDQSEACTEHVACIAQARVGSTVPMPNLRATEGAGSEEYADCVSVLESLSHANFPSPRWYEDRVQLISGIESWENTVNDPWEMFDPADPIDRFNLQKAKDTLAYMRMTLEERFGR